MTLKPNAWPVSFKLGAIVLALSSVPLCVVLFCVYGGVASGPIGGVVLLGPLIFIQYSILLALRRCFPGARLGKQVQDSGGLPN